MKTLFMLGMFVAVAAPLLRQQKQSAFALAAGAGVLIAISVFAMMFPDLRAGEGALEESWRFSLLTLGCEAPVLILALVAVTRWKKAFWVGWAIHLLLTVWVITMLVWLTFFWHW